MTTYLTNAFSLGMLGEGAFKDLNGKEYSTIIVHRASVEEVKRFMSYRGFISAVGHKSTADFLSELLGVNVEYNRIQIELKRGDVVIVFQLQQRLPEGALLEDLAGMKYQFFIVTVTYL